MGERRERTVDLRIDVTTHGEWAVVSVGGEVDVATAPTLREKIIALINAGSHQLVVDLSFTEFIDSTGLGVLIGARKRTSANGGAVVVVTADRRIRRVFEITGLDSIFDMYESVEQVPTS